MEAFRYSIWLMPCAEQCDPLEETIRQLAERFGTPPFLPHITLCSGIWEKEESKLNGLVERLAAELPIPMSAGEIDWTDQWSAFFFLRLSGAGAFFERAAFLVDGSHLPPVGPHMSLLYALNVSEIDRAALRQELAGCLPPLIYCDRLAVVCPEAGCWEPVNRWHILHTAG